MENNQVFYRLWCKSCENYVLHIENENNEYVCRTCEIIYTHPNIKDIPHDKLKQQRERYKKYSSTKFHNLLTFMLTTGDLWPSERIVESDAGVESIRREKRIKKEERRKTLEEKVDMYKGLTRNDICNCGSGKKYKKCCLQSIREYKLELGI